MRARDAGLGLILQEAGIHPVLVDIGSSGASRPIWEGIARQSVYVGFDPDLREIKTLEDGHFHRAWIVNRAVSVDETQQEAEFYLTRSPFCSSTLRPAATALQEYLFADLFEVERVTRVPATTLTAVLRDLSLERIDWFKTDSQGTDLRLFLSLPEDLRSLVLAVDLEPGLIDAYDGEDQFPGVHEEMRRGGFWLSNLEVHGAVRMRPATANALGNGLSRNQLEATLRRSPGWVEARYFRTPAWLRDHGCGPREHLLLWIFAMLDGQLGFALDVASDYQRLFPADRFAPQLRAETLRRLNATVRPRRLRRVGRSARRVLARLRGLLDR